MTTETKATSLLMSLSVILTGIAIFLGSLIFPPMGLVFFGLLLIVLIITGGTSDKDITGKKME